MYLEKLARELFGLAKMGLKVLRNSVYAEGGVMGISCSSSVLILTDLDGEAGLAESRQVEEVQSRSSEGKVMFLGVLSGGS